MIKYKAFWPFGFGAWSSASLLFVSRSAYPSSAVKGEGGGGGEKYEGRNGLGESETEEARTPKQCPTKSGRTLHHVGLHLPCGLTNLLEFIIPVQVQLLFPLVKLMPSLM